MKVLRFLKNLFTAGIVLLYHRVNDLPSDPQLLSVSPEHFREHLEILRKSFQPMSLKTMMEAASKGNLPRRAVAVTFDDGYKDNFLYAKPLLERFDIPATFFVIAGVVGKKEELWWDELERLLLLPGKLPQKITLKIADKSFEWQMNSDALYTEEMHQKYQRWNVLDKDDPLSRQLIYRTLHRELRSLPHNERMRALESLARLAGAGNEGRESHRMLSHDELISLSKSELFEVGAHTINHPQLTSLPVEDQKEEIQQSKAKLQDLVGLPVTSFAYPYGTRLDYTETTVQLVRESGFSLACSNFPGRVQTSADLFQIPRFIIRNEDGDQFHRNLRTWFGG